MAIDEKRRLLLQASGLASGFALFGLPGVARAALASAPTENRILLVILRGAMDGLAAIVPYGDKAYADARGALAMPQDAESLIRLDSYFAMHHALQPLSTLYQNKQMAVLHAVASPYRERSHFDAQDCLENGSDRAHGLNSGWLNRTLSVLRSNQEAIAIGSSIPLALRGAVPVNSWAPNVLPNVDDEFLARVMAMYENDVPLHQSLAQAQSMAEQGEGMQVSGKNREFISLMQKAASFMSLGGGARIGTVELGGWDTHANQGLGSGRLATNFKLLADGLVAYQQAMGSSWNNTVVMVATEFGRTVKVNGTNGSDHGTASSAFLLGGRVNGGQVIGDWPGLTKLYENRDLVPANDLRSLFKGVLEQHMGIDRTALNSLIFPNSAQTLPFAQLLRA